MISKVLANGCNTARHHVSEFIGSNQPLYGYLHLLTVRILYLQKPKFISANKKLSKTPDDTLGKGPDGDILKPSRKTYILHNIALDKSEEGNSSQTQNSKDIDDYAPSLYKTKLTAEKVYKNIQSKFKTELTPKQTSLGSENISGKHWVIKSQPPTYNIDLMYKRAMDRRNSQLFENIKSVYLKRLESMQHLMNKSTEKTAVGQKRCTRSTPRTLHSQAPSNVPFHTFSHASKKRKDETETHVESGEKKKAKPLDVRKDVVKDPRHVDKKIMSIDTHTDKKTEIEIKMTNKDPKTLVAEHCSHKVVHKIRYEDGASKEKAVLKKTEEIFDVHKADKGVPVHIKSITNPVEDEIAVAKTSSEGVSKTTTEKEPTTVVKEKVEKQLTRKDFIKKDPRTKFSGFPTRSGKPGMESKAIGPSKDVTSE